MKKAIITILGTITSKNGEASYRFDPNIITYEKPLNFINVFPLFVKYLSHKYDIIPFYTGESLNAQKEVLKFHNIDFDIQKHGIEINENDPSTIFNSISKILSNEDYQKVIIDITHGFRSIPILATINMMISHFHNSQKIENVIYAQEKDKEKKDYLIKDLSEYLEIANIAFVLSAFGKNYTVASHIDSKNYTHLIEKLNAFSNDIMALNLNNLFNKSSIELLDELQKLENPGIKDLAYSLSVDIKKSTTKRGKRYLTYYFLSKELLEKNYILLSLSLLFESMRLFIKSYVKSKEPEIAEKVKKSLKSRQDYVYAVSDFYKNLMHKIDDKHERDIKNMQNTNLSKNEYLKLKKTYDSLGIKHLYKDVENYRNDLAHANSSGNFKQIKKSVQDLLSKYYKSYIDSRP